MSEYSSLKATINANIKANNNQEITGSVMNSVLNAMVNTLGAGYQFAGVATTATNPGTPDAKVFYIANGKGTYTNFGGLQVTEDDVVVLTWDSAWHKIATGIASQEKLSELNKKIEGETELYTETSLTDAARYDMSNGQYIDDGAKSKVFVLNPSTDKIVASFSKSHWDFGIILYKGENFIKSYEAAESITIDLNEYKADRIIVQSYSNWKVSVEFYVSGIEQQLESVKAELESVKELMPSEPKVTYIVAQRNANDYNSIRETISGINDASERNQYVILIPKGRWFECDIQGKPFVQIVGENREETIIYCDGTSDKITPNDYSFANYAGVAINTIPQSYRHVFNILNSTEVKNLTIEASDCKYCVHIDDYRMEKAFFSNCKFTPRNCNNAIGMGLRGYQSVNVDNCIFVDNGNYAVFVHNIGNQTKGDGSKLIISRCYFNGCNFAKVDELGSNQEDIWAINNCYSSAVNPTIEFMAEGTDAINLPYCIRLNTLGTNVKKFIKRSSRPNAEQYVIADFSQIVA